jgi:phage FluMu protein Com
MAIIVKCSSCGKTMNVSDSMAGKKGKCPGCKAVIIVPGSDAVEAAPAPPGREAKICPNCGKQLDADDVFCVGCGTNLDTGVQVEGL